MNQTIHVAAHMGRLLTGRFTGRQHFAKCCELLAGLPPSSTVTLDFSDTEYVSAYKPLPPSVEEFWNRNNTGYLVLGHTHIPMIERLSRGTVINPGSVIELDREVQEPVDMLLDGRLVARGEVVVINGDYGLRITEVAPTPSL